MQPRNIKETQTVFSAFSDQPQHILKNSPAHSLARSMPGKDANELGFPPIRMTFAPGIRSIDLLMGLAHPAKPKTLLLCQPFSWKKS